MNKNICSTISYGCDTNFLCKPRFTSHCLYRSCGTLMSEVMTMVQDGPISKGTSRGKLGDLYEDILPLNGQMLSLRSGTCVIGAYPHIELHGACAGPYYISQPHVCTCRLCIQPYMFQ